MNFATRSLIDKRLFRDGPPEEFELLFNISASARDCVGARRPRTEIDQLLHVDKRFFAGEFRPGFFGRRFRARHRKKKAQTKQPTAPYEDQHLNSAQRSLEPKPTMLKMRWRSSSP